MNLRDAITSHPTVSAFDLATSLVDQIDKNEIILILSNEISRIRRTEVSSVERSVFSSLASNTPQVSLVTPDYIQAFKELFDEKFKLGDGTEVEWGKATVEEHLIRRDMLTKKRDGLTRTISRHDEAIRILTVTGARCLDEVQTLV